MYGGGSELVRKKNWVWLEVIKLPASFLTYSSFTVTVDEKFRDKIFFPDEWEEGVLIRPFYGQVMDMMSDNIDN